MQIDIDDKTIQRLKQLFPDRLAGVMTSTDVSFFADFMAGLGIDVVNTVLEKHPDLTFGQLITRYSTRH